MTATESALLGSLGSLDLFAISAALVAGVLAFRCARNPMYHSSRLRRRHDRRLWIFITVAMVMVALYQLLAAQVVVHTYVPRFVQIVADHGVTIEQAFYAAGVVGILMASLTLYAWVGGSARRNVVAVFGLFVVLISLGLGVLGVADDARRLAAGRPSVGSGSLQVAGIVAGSILIALSAWLYRQRQTNQIFWRRQLRESNRNHSSASGEKADRRPGPSRPASVN